MALREKESAVVEAEKELQRTKNQALASEAKATAGVLAAKSEFTITQDKLAKLRDQKAKSRIVAPTEGLVVYSKNNDWHRSETQIEEGAQVYERQTLIELPDTTSMKVVIRVHEAKTEKLKIGLPAVVEIEGFTGQQFSGKVSKIGVLADSRSRWLNPNLKEYETEILLDGRFSQLKPGITARAQILVTEMHNVLAVPVQAVFGKGGKYFVFVADRGSTRPLEVKVGLSSNEYAEIKEGLSEGQLVRLAVTDEIKLMLPEESEEDAEKKEQPPAPPPVKRAKPKRSPDSRPASQPAL
jgi:HlyD family secretion protein